MHFVFRLDLKKEVYLRGIECRPSNRRVAHHAVGILDASGTARKLDEKHPGPGYPGYGPGFIPAGFTPGYAPGKPLGSSMQTQPSTQTRYGLRSSNALSSDRKDEEDQTEIGLIPD